MICNICTAQLGERHQVLSHLVRVAAALAREVVLRVWPGEFPSGFGASGGKFGVKPVRRRWPSRIRRR